MSRFSKLKNSLTRKSKKKPHNIPEVDAGASSPVSTIIYTSTAEDASQLAQSLQIPGTIHPPSHEQVTSSDTQCASPSRHPATTVSAVTSLSPAASNVQVAPSMTGVSPSSSIPEQLWDRAYNNLKNDEPTVVEAYEKILSRELDENASTPLALKDQRNMIEQTNQEKRRSQMNKLIETGLKKTEKEAKVKQGIGNTMQVVLVARDTIGSAVQVCPQAALAWTGVSLALQVSLSTRDHDYGS